MKRSPSLTAFHVIAIRKRLLLSIEMVGTSRGMIACGFYLHKNHECGYAKELYKEIVSMEAAKFISFNFYVDSPEMNMSHYVI